MNLAKLDKIASQLASIESVSEAVDLRNKSKAIETYSKSIGNCKEIERSAVVVRLRCERRLGELLAKTVKPGNPHWSHAGTIGEKLSDMGISKSQSSRYQSASKLPNNEFEAYIETASTKDLSTSGVLKLVQLAERDQERHGPASGHSIITGDIADLGDKIEDDSIDLILTDPPYADLECYSKLAELAADKLKPGSLCIAYSGQYYLPDVLERMTEHLDYFWTIALRFGSSHTAIHPRKVQCSWKPILCFAKGKAKRDEWIVDHLEGGGCVKQLHDWQQPESESHYLIEKLTRPGDLVCDPFTGSGSTLQAAQNLGRNYIGCEIDAGTAMMARRRLAA